MRSTLLAPVQPPPSSGVWLRIGAMAFLLVVASAAPSLPRGITNWDNVVKVQLALNLLRGEGLALTAMTPDDEQYVLHGTDGRRYSAYLPLAAALHVLTVEVALLTGVEAEGVPALLLLGLLAWALVSWGRRAGASPAAAAAGAVLACLGTALWPMAALGYDIVMSALALAMVLRAGAAANGGMRPWLAAGLTLGAAIATRFDAALIAVPAAVLAVAAPERGVRAVVRRGAALAAGAGPGVLLVLWYNAHRFGSPLLFAPPGSQGDLDGFLAPWFSARHLEGIAGLLLSPGKGLFWYAPPMLLVAALAPALARRNRAIALAFAAYAVAAVLEFGRFRYWHADWCWGPRYLAPLLIACAPVGWLVWDGLSERRAHARAAALAVVVGAAALQVAPVIGRPIPHHFALVLQPLAREGRLATRPITRPPGPEDYGILYFAPQHSMIVSLARGLVRAAAKPGFAERVVRAMLVPIAGGALVAGAWLAGARRPRGPESGPGERGSSGVTA